MNALELLMAWFLLVGGIPEPCNAVPAEVVTLTGQTYQIMQWSCGLKHFRIWQRYCLEGKGFWGRPFFLEETTEQSGIYLNSFGELVTGYHVMISETYIPKCGT